MRKKGLNKFSLKGTIDLTSLSARAEFPQFLVALCSLRDNGASSPIFKTSSLCLWIFRICIKVGTSHVFITCK